MSLVRRTYTNVRLFKKNLKWIFVRIRNPNVDLAKEVRVHSPIVFFWIMKPSEYTTTKRSNISETRQVYYKAAWLSPKFGRGVTNLHG
jgi:hypothetical protein